MVNNMVPTLQCKTFVNFYSLLETFKYNFPDKYYFKSRFAGYPNLEYEFKDVDLFLFLSKIKHLFRKDEIDFYYIFTFFEDEGHNIFLDDRGKDSISFLEKFLIDQNCPAYDKNLRVLYIHD